MITLIVLAAALASVGVMATPTVSAADLLSPTIMTSWCFIEATGASTPTSSCTPSTATDAGASITPTETIPATLELGLHKVLVNATDSSGNWAATTRAILVADTTPPTCTSVRYPVYVEARAPLTAILPQDAKIAPADTASTLDELHLSTNARPLQVDQGRTVLWTVEDRAGNTAKCTQRIIVLDTTPPSFPDTIPPIIHPSAVPVSVSSVPLVPPAATDIADPILAIYHEETGMFELGVNTVTWLAIDASVNVATATQKVIVQAP